MSAKERIHRGSGNVFADIGVAHPERVLARSQIMSRITDIIRERGLTQKQASLLLDIPQSKVSLGAKYYMKLNLIANYM